MPTIIKKELQTKVAATSKNVSSSHKKTPFCAWPPHYRHDYYVCTNCGTYSCGGLYSSFCTKCKGVISDPPRETRLSYLCIKCARFQKICTCDQIIRPVTPVPLPIFRSPPKYCWCSCCKCCTYTCSCSYCSFFCECLSAPCERYEPCCYCSRICGPNKVCCKTRQECFWSWCPCWCIRPPSS